MNQNKNCEILVIGSINADLVVQVSSFPKPGETISGSDLKTIPGGKGANQAVAAAKLGAKVGMVGSVGNDIYGKNLIANLNTFNIDTHYIKVDSETSTGTAIIIIDQTGENSIVISPGANGKVTAKNIREAIHLFESAKFLLLQFEIPEPTIFEAAKIAKQNNLTVILNPAPARDFSQQLLSYIDILIPNETELERITGISTSTQEQIVKAAHRLLDSNLSAIIVTLGEKGALLVTKNKTQHFPGIKVNVIDTTAAGDSFIGGLAAALLKEKSIEEAIRYANCAGALATTKLGAQPSIPDSKSVETLYKSQRK